MKAIYYAETSVDFERTTRRYIAQDRTLHNHRCENLKFYVKIFISWHSEIQQIGLSNVKFNLKHTVLFTVCVNLRVTSVRS
jgi:hypothetical protein